MGRATEGDVAAFGILARRHGPLMRVVAARLLSADAESDDVVQDAFVSAWRSLPELDDPQRLRSWLLRIVSNRALDRLRTRREHADIDDWEQAAPAHRAPEKVVEHRLQLDALHEALGRLPADQRRCWLLRETAGYSYQEIADALEVPVSTVRGLLARSRVFLLHEMEGWR